MRRWPNTIGLALALAACVGHMNGAQLKLDFRDTPEDSAPKDFSNLLAGEGAPGEWRVIQADFPSAMTPFGGGPNTSRRKVVAQVSTAGGDERFPLLALDGATFSDFTLTTRIRTVAGKEERMAGIAFRLQDAKNFYVVRASSLGNNVRFYKVVGGVRSVPIGNDIPVPSDTWHTLKITCRGTHIRAWLNDQEVIPELTDTSFSKGRIAFWTKSDSVSWFADTVVDYTPTEPPANALIRAVLKEHPKLPGIRIYMPVGEPRQLKVVASRNAADVGQPGGVNEQKVMDSGVNLCRRDADAVTVVMPLRDRNGEVLAAVRLVLPTFVGQTEANAITRARPMIQIMQKTVRDRKDVVED